VSANFLKPFPGCFSSPHGLEGLLTVLPRKWLDEVQIRGLPGLFSDEQYAPVLNFWSNRRVAFVRQSTCLITYSPGNFSTWQDRVLTTKRHPGPLALLADLRADFQVVRQDRDPETFAWRGKHLGDPDPEQTFRKMEEYRLREESHPGVVSCDDIRWEDYDLVVCLDVPVPARITRRTRRTLWTYLSIEAGGPLQVGSLRAPVDGYHLFFNHHFRRFRVRPANRPHVLEFPYALQSRNSWNLLFGHLGLRDSPRSGVLADLASLPELPASGDSGLAVMGSDGKRLDLGQMAALYASKKYALRLDPRRRWGNWLVEVIQAGCLFLGRPDTLNNISPLLPGLAVHDYRAARKKIDELEGNLDLFAAYRALQSAITEHVAFRRPLADLTARARRFFDGR